MTAPATPSQVPRAAHGISLVALLGSLVLAPGTWAEEVDLATPAGYGAPTTLRVVTANLGHLNFPKSAIDQGVDVEPMIWGMIDYLDGLEIPGQGNVFALQEVDRFCRRSMGVDWPYEIDESFGRWDGTPLTGYVNVFNPAHRCRGGSAGNASITNVQVRTAYRWDLTEGCPSDGSTRNAVALDLAYVGIPIWVVNLHLLYCREGDYRENSCQLDNLMRRIDRDLPPKAAVVITGDFNVREEAPESTLYCPHDRALHQEAFDRLVRVTTRWGFLRLASAGADHVFVRDPGLVLKGATTRIVRPRGLVQGIDVALTDHDTLVTDFKIRGLGMSPLFVSLLATL